MASQPPRELSLIELVGQYDYYETDSPREYIYNVSKSILRV